MAASEEWNLFHLDLKTAFLQEHSYDVNRDVVCQLPPKAGHPPYIAARLKKPAQGMNHAPRRWWNILDKALCSYGMVPTRADRCCYVLYSIPQRKPPHTPSHSGQQLQPVARPPGEDQIQPLASQGSYEDSATVEPRSRVSNRSSSPQGNERPQK